jgi:peptidylprolyl isomerase
LFLSFFFFFFYSFLSFPFKKKQIIQYTATKDPGQSVFKFKVGLGQVITGWDEGVLDMSIGETSKLTCTPDYAYGAGGFPAWGIMPDSTLVFEIELLSFK